MRNLIFLICFLPCILFGQTGTWPVAYGNGAPNYTPSSAGTHFYIDRLTNDFYTYSTTWILKGRGIDQITGTIAPLYTPGPGQSQFAINNANPPQIYRHNGGGVWQCVTCPAPSISETRVKQIADSLQLGEIEKYSGRFISARVAGDPLVVGFMGDSQFDRYYRNVQHFLSGGWSNEFQPNGPGYCTAFNEHAGVEGFGYNPVVLSGSWVQANTITNTPPTVEEGLNGRYAQTTDVGANITFESTAMAEWPNVEKFENLKIYTKANGSQFSINIDFGAYTGSFTTQTHGGVNVTTINNLGNVAHKITITCQAGTLRVYGISGYNVDAGKLTIQRFAQGSSSFESWNNRFNDTSYISKIRTLYPVPQVVFCNLGSNDYLDGINVDSFKYHVTRFITKFKTYLPNTDLVFTSQMDGTLDAGRRKDQLKQIVKGYYNIKVCNLYDIFGDHAGSMISGQFEVDQVHWSEIGAKLAAPFLLKFIVPTPTPTPPTTPTTPGGANRSIQVNNSGSFNGLSEIRSPNANSVFIGENAGENATSTSNSYAVGSNALQSNVSGSNNIAIGSNAGQTSTSSSGIYIGKDACKNCGARGGSYGTVVIGNNSLDGTFSGTLGNDNFIIGNQTGRNMDSGNNNTLLGNNTGNSISSGFTNVLIGPYTGQLMSGGFSNVLIGALTGNGIQGGGQNIVFGRQALGSADASNSIIIGHQAAGSTANASNAVVIGFQAGQSSNVTNKLWFANSNTTTPLFGGDFSTGQVGINVANASPVASAQLQVESTTRGFLPPRMTTSQRNAIASPATGLTLFCTDCTATDTSTGVTQSWNGTAWKNYW